MTRTVYLENWHKLVESTIDDILIAAGQTGLNTPEQIALLAERNILDEMIHQVRGVDPEQRQRLDSPLIACSVRDSLEIPATIIEKVGEIHDIYRRFRNRLVWPTMGEEID